MKISFLIAAHNEEKLIAGALNNLTSLPYTDYEIILGLDGCTDNTESIVKDFIKRSSKIKYFNLNIRKGKPAVINNLIRKAKGEVIIIHDADWIFRINDKNSLKVLISAFKDKKVGGIAESFPLEWDSEKIRTGNLGFKIVAYSSYLWLNFQKSRFTQAHNKNFFAIESPTMFLTNIFRRELYKDNSSLGDDFERTYDIMKQKYKVLIIKDKNLPRMISSYDYVSLYDLFKLKIRTARAREQIKEEQNLSLSNYYVPAIYYMIKNSWKYGFSVGLMIIYWVIMTSIATIVSKFKNFSTKEGWLLRMKR